MNDAQALSRCVTCLLDNTTPDGTWTDFQVEWNPIITALTCKLLLSCGLAIDTPWYVNESTSARCSLANSLTWLNSVIRSDGTFGTDFWDAAQLGIVVEAFGLQDWLPAYESLKRYLLKAIKAREFATDQSQWQGPGFWAAAIEYLRAVHHIKDANSLSRELIKMSVPDGCWQGHLDPSGAPIVSPVWHTSQCIIVLSCDHTPDHPVIAKALGWLKRSQHKSGAWVSVQQYKIYFTAYAILALLYDRDSEGQSLKLAVEYLKNQIGSDGKCSDLGGTLMCALALRAVVGNDFEKEITLVDFLLARKNLTKAHTLENALKARDSEVQHLKTELDRYEKKYGEADFVVTKKQLFLLLLLGLFLTAVGTVAGVYALNAVLKPSVPTQSAPASMAAPQPVPQPAQSAPLSPKQSDIPAHKDSQKKADLKKP